MFFSTWSIKTANQIITSLGLQLYYTCLSSCKIAELLAFLWHIQLTSTTSWKKIAALYSVGSITINLPYAHQLIQILNICALGSLDLRISNFHDLHMILRQFLQFCPSVSSFFSLTKLLQDTVMPLHIIHSNILLKIKVSIQPCSHILEVVICHFKKLTGRHATNTWNTALIINWNLIAIEIVHHKNSDLTSVLSSRLWNIYSLVSTVLHLANQFLV